MARRTARGTVGIPRVVLQPLVQPLVLYGGGSGWKVAYRRPYQPVDKPLAISPTLLARNAFFRMSEINTVQENLRLPKYVLQNEFNCLLRKKNVSS